MSEPTALTNLRRSARPVARPGCPIIVWEASR